MARFPIKAWLQYQWRKLLKRLRWRATSSAHARLTLVSQFFPPDFAATGQLLNDLTEHLASRGLQVQVLTGMPAYAYTTTKAYRLEFQPNRCIRRTRASRLWPSRIRGRAINGLMYCLRISLRLLRFSRRGDLLLYTTEPPYLPILAWLFFRLTRTPYILILYDLYPDVLVELGVLTAAHPLVRIWRRLNGWAFADATEIIVLSEPMVERVSAEVPQAKAKISVIPSWADPEVIVPRSKANNWFVQKHKLNNQFVVLYSGNQGRCHDLITVIAAALILRHDHDVRFVFIGNGNQHSRIENLVHELCLTNCLFLPYQELSDLPFSLAAADLALVTLGLEARGLVAPSKLYGHLATATPIAAITPHNSYLRPLLEENRCGRWFANGDAQGLASWILQLKADPALAKTLGNAARELLLRTATPKITTDQYQKLINSHLKKSYSPLMTDYSKGLYNKKMIY